jgi:hypothetical protein
MVENGLPIDGLGGSDGTLACCTCHLIFEEHKNENSEATTDEENGTFHLAFSLTDHCWAAKPILSSLWTIRFDAMADARQSIDISKNS